MPIVIFLKGRVSSGSAFLLCSFLFGCSGDDLGAQKKALELPGCGVASTTDNVVTQLNMTIAFDPMMKRIAGNVRVISLSEVKEIHSDEGIRACEATVKRSDGSEGSVGYTVAWLNREGRLPLVQIENLAELRANSAPPLAPLPATASPPTAEPLPAAREVVTYDQCIEEHSDQMGMLECAESELDRQKGILKSAFESKMAEETTNKAVLADDQAKWEKQMEGLCVVDETTATPDSARSSIVCEFSAVARRILQIGARKAP